MIKLKKFYDLLHKSQEVKLCNGSLDMICYEGAVRKIPAVFDEMGVIDFAVRERGDVLFLIEVKDGRAAPRNTNDSPIARLRRARGLTQGQLAQMVGCYAKDISRWENGERKPASKSLHALAKALECTVDELMGE